MDVAERSRQVTDRSFDIAVKTTMLSNLKEALGEAIEMNREDARNAAGATFEEVTND